MSVVFFREVPGEPLYTADYVLLTLRAGIFLSFFLCFSFFFFLALSVALPSKPAAHFVAGPMEV